MKLDNVTLISYDDTGDPTRTMKALLYCSKLIEFADVILVCNVKPIACDNIRFSPVRPRGYEGAMQWEVSEVGKYVSTDFALCIHYDGYIVNPEKWNPDWLQYDFIGSPWPLNPTDDHPGSLDFPNSRVGNTGFCLKSKAFMKRCAEITTPYNARTYRDGYGIAGDVFCCQLERETLEFLGMKFAPVEVAADFGWECNIDEYPQGRPDAFGFHNFNGKNGHIPKL
jgi:hypothetical protein